MGPQPIVVIHDVSWAYNKSPRWWVDLLATIEERVDPGSWMGRGGDWGACEWFGQCLVVLQTPENQVAVAELLAELR
jgi:hypothetical protein